MLAGFYLSIADSDSWMFPDSIGLPRCSGCGYRRDFSAHKPRYRLRDVRKDLCATYDGQIIGSLTFKRFCEQNRYTGIRFLEFETDEIHFHVLIDNSVPFGFERRKTRFERMCVICGNYESVVGASPAFLKVGVPLADGFFRTDLLFGSGDGKSPAWLVAEHTRAKMEVAGLRGIGFVPAFGLEK